MTKQKEGVTVEGYLTPDHMPMMILMPPKYAVSQAIGFITGKSAVRIARRYAGGKGNYVDQHCLRERVLRLEDETR